MLIGGTDADREGLWKWSDGTAWGYARWKGGEPNRRPGDGNVAAYSKDDRSPDGRAWVDTASDRDYAFLCAATECPKSKTACN